MSSINVDMLKQLLDDFLAKEQLTGQEITATEQKINELKVQIESCQQKLFVVAQDREKIAQMMQRYTNQESLAPASTIIPVSKSTKSSSKRAVAEETPPHVAVPQAGSSEASKPAPVVEEEETVKNINDALRQLFHQD